MSLRFYQANVWAATAVNWHEPRCWCLLSLTNANVGLPSCSRRAVLSYIYNNLCTSDLETWSISNLNTETVIISFPSSSSSHFSILSYLAHFKPAPALLASSNWIQRYSRALCREHRFGHMTIVYVGCILGDWCISNKELQSGHFDVRRVEFSV